MKNPLLLWLFSVIIPIIFVAPIRIRFVFNALSFLPDGYGNAWTIIVVLVLAFLVGTLAIIYSKKSALFKTLAVIATLAIDIFSTFLGIVILFWGVR